MAQHASLSLERWRQFTLDQQILMIANEMHRSTGFFGSEDAARLRNSYERALALVDLTVRAHSARGLRRELLRWRGLVAALYIAPAPPPGDHAAALHTLLRFTPTASRQIEHLAT